MSIGYHVAQAGQLVKRRFLRGLLIIFVTAIVTLGVSLAAAGYYGNVSDLTALSEQVVVTVFLEMDADSLDALYVREQMNNLDEIADVSILYPNEAKADFERRYGTPTRNLLPDNPFPITITALLHDEYRTPLGAESAVNKSKRIAKVDDARFRSTFVSALQDRWRQLFTVWVAAGCIIAIVFFVFLALAIRHSTGLTREEAEILSLTGARRIFIATPHILYSIFFVLLGVSGGSAAAIAIYRGIQENLPALNLLPEILPYAAGATLVVTVVIAVQSSLQTAKH